MKSKALMKIKKYSPILILVICIAVAASILIIPRHTVSSRIDLSERSSVNAICELATLKSFYHNVVVYEKEPDGGEKFVNDVLFWPFGGYTKVGYKQYWMEYSGSVEAGIDANLIQIMEPDSQGNIEVYIPDAKIIRVDPDEDSLTEPLTEKGWFTTISLKEKKDAFSSAQNAMSDEAENDQALKQRAKENAKVLLEQYIVNVGNQMGLDLTVKWIEKP